MSAPRSFELMIDNNSSATLTLINASLEHGEWTDGMTPPQVIPAQAAGIVIQAQSDGFLTGCQGSVLYDSTAGGLTMSFDGPFDGENSFGASAASGYPAPTWAGVNDWTDSSHPTVVVTLVATP